MNLKQLSDMLALSQTTVSRALNGYPEVSEETRRRVADAAKRHGYRPNPSARRLATGKAGMIGYVMPTGAAVDHRSAFRRIPVRSRRLRKRPRSRSRAVADGCRRGGDDLSPRRRQQAGRRRLRVLAAPGRPAYCAAQPARHSVHRAWHAARGSDFDYAFLDIDNEAAFHDAARLLVQLGHARIALINGDTQPDLRHLPRARAYGRALAASGLTLPPERIRSVAMTEENGFRAAKSLLEGSAPPTAIVCSSLIMALGVVRAIRDLGLTIPGDVSLIAHDDVFPWLKPENFSVPLTTTRSSIRAAGTARR